MKHEAVVSEVVVACRRLSDSWRLDRHSPMSRTLTHYQVGPTLAKCGKHLDPSRLTAKPSNVTCKACQRGNHPSAQSQGQTTARENPFFGDPNYPGSGLLTCRLCGRPYIDHPLAAPCPYGSMR